MKTVWVMHPRAVPYLERNQRILTYLSVSHQVLLDTFKVRYGMARHGTGMHHSRRFHIISRKNKTFGTLNIYISIISIIYISFIRRISFEIFKIRYKLIILCSNWRIKPTNITKTSYKNLWLVLVQFIFFSK